MTADELPSLDIGLGNLSVSLSALEYVPTPYSHEPDAERITATSSRRARTRSSMLLTTDRFTHRYVPGGLLLDLPE